jgi:hypothetical protein
MKYAVWLVRLVFAAWMIPAGLNHFIPLFPQPMGLHRQGAGPLDMNPDSRQELRSGF